MSATWRVFGNKIALQPDKVEKITLAACALHNFLIEHQQISAITADTDNEPGNWRNLPHNGMGALNRIGRPAPENARAIREEYRHFANNEGAVAWQEDMI